MAVRHQLIAREPSVLWAVLEDESRYTDWVVGTFGSGPGDGRWPEVGSSIKYTVRVGPKEFHGRTTVRRLDALRALELEAHGGPLGTARIAFDVRPWGDKTLVILDEHPLRGLGGSFHNTVLDAFAQIRHRSMLRRLAEVVEEMPQDTGRAAEREDQP
ncbi:SRPBCC family protein [Streptomyces sp. NPDC056308]|uniref:SRPBCC family protein n=1 Tax=unclassified Streptomyces TaxID=2593676 RepID=UPI0035D8FD1F